MLLPFRNEGRKAAIIFVHGFAGDAAASWTQFAQLLTSDPRAADWDCFSFGYKSIGTSVRAVAAELRATIGSSKLARYQQIAFIAHSTGGLILQSALLDYDDLARRVTSVFLFALPTHGLAV